MRQRSRTEASEDRRRTLLSEAERLLPRYLGATDGLAHESKGIRRSELFFFYAVVAASQPGRIVESGRARAQSTLVLARLFPEIPIVSLESDQNSPDAAIAAERLRGCGNVDCRFGDSLLLLPQLVRAGDVVLIDGPKDFRALKLALRLLGSGQPGAVFVHDLWLESQPRRFVERHLPRALFSDEPAWVERYATLDSGATLRPPPPERAGPTGPRWVASSPATMTTTAACNNVAPPKVEIACARSRARFSTARLPGGRPISKSFRRVGLTPNDCQITIRRQAESAVGGGDASATFAR